jgi:hypothetical protein
MSNQRIQLHDSTLAIVSKMCEGNPGAMQILMEMLSPKTDEIDPNNMLGGMGAVLMLDTVGIYGGGIYTLHNDICGRDMVKTLAVIRAVQLAFLDGVVLRNACSLNDRSGKDMVPVEELYKKVKERLPEFK